MPAPAPAPNLSPETDRALEQLILSARASGFASALAEVTSLLVTLAHMENSREVFTALAKGLDAISKKGPSNA